MLKRISQLKELSFSDWKIILLSSLLLPATAFSLHFFGLRKTQEALKKISSPVIETQADCQVFPPAYMAEAQNIAKLVSITARHGIYKANCLKQVLVLWHLLNKQDIPSTLHIGIKKKDTNQLDAHAWLECAGTPLIDSKDSLQLFSSIHTS